MIDPLRPIDEHNRDERLLIEYDGYLTNRAEYYLLCILEREALLKVHPNLKDKYPSYPDSSIFNGANGDTIFASTARFTPKDLFSVLDPSITQEEYEKELSDESIFHSPAYIRLAERQRVTSYFFALQNLAKQKFVKQIGITCKRELEEPELTLLYQQFGPEVTDGIDKLAFYCGDVSSILKEEHYTSIFMNDIEELYQYLTNTDPELLRNRMFFIRDYYSNMKPDPENATLYQFKYRDEIDRLCTKYKCGISSAPLTCLEEDNEE